MKKGFTLIELLVVVAIIAILAVVIFINLSRTRPKARDSRRKNDIATIQTAVEMYLDQNVSPPGAANTTYRSTNSTNWDALLDALNAGAGGNVIATLPRDPINDGNDQYIYRHDNATYELNCRMEQDDDAEQNDGGDNDNVYEVGTDPGLDLLN